MDEEYGIFFKISIGGEGGGNFFSLSMKLNFHFDKNKSANSSLSENFSSFFYKISFHSFIFPQFLKFSFYKVEF